MELKVSSWRFHVDVTKDYIVHGGVRFLRNIILSCLFFFCFIFMSNLSERIAMWIITAATFVSIYLKKGEYNCHYVPYLELIWKSWTTTVLNFRFKFVWKRYKLGKGSKKNDPFSSLLLLRGPATPPPLSSPVGNLYFRSIFLGKLNIW